MCQETSKIARTAAFSCLLLLFSLTTVATAMTPKELCAAAVPLPLAGTLRLVPTAESSVGDGGGDGVLWVQVVVLEAGILNLEIFDSSDATKALELRPAGLGCDGEKEAVPVILEHSAVHLMMLTTPRPEPYLFRIATRDGGQALGEVVIHSAFVTAREPEEIFARGGEDEEIIEIEADPLISLPPSASRSMPAMLYDLCRRELDLDDHGDTLTCATLLGAEEEMEGQISGQEGGDVDVFLLVLGAAEGGGRQRVEIETVGDLDTVGTLFDRAGRRLGHDDDGGSVRNFHLTEPLDPGMYYLRVAGHEGAVGPYSLRLKKSPIPPSSEHQTPR